MPTKSEVFFFITVIIIGLLVSAVYKYIHGTGAIWMIIIGIVAMILGIRGMVNSLEEEKNE